MSAGVLYFALNSASGSLDPFASSMLTGRHLDAGRVGLLMSFRSIAAIFLSAPWAAFADATGLQSLVLSVCVGASAASALTALVALNSKEVSFASVVVAFALLALFRAPLGPLVDAAAMRQLGPKRPGEYGLLRVWGAVGYGITGTAVGLALAKLEDDALALVAFSFFSMVALVASQFVGSALKAPPEDRGLKGESRPGLWKIFSTVLKYPGLWKFGLSLVVLGCAQGVISTFFPVFLRDQKGMPQGSLGWAVLLSVVSEIPVFLISPKLLGSLGSFNLLVLAHVFTVVRLLLMAALPAGPLLLLPQLLHGLTFAAAWVSAIVFVTEITPPAAAVTANSLVSTLYTGGGYLLANLVGGRLYSHGSPRSFFVCVASLVAVSLVVFASSFFRRAKNAKKSL